MGFNTGPDVQNLEVFFPVEAMYVYPFGIGSEIMTSGNKVYNFHICIIYYTSMRDTRIHDLVNH